MHACMQSCAGSANAAPKGGVGGQHRAGGGALVVTAPLPKQRSPQRAFRANAVLYVQIGFPAHRYMHPTRSAYVASTPQEQLSCTQVHQVLP